METGKLETDLIKTTVLIVVTVLIHSISPKRCGFGCARGMMTLDA